MLKLEMDNDIPVEAYLKAVEAHEFLVTDHPHDEMVALHYSLQEPMSWGEVLNCLPGWCKNRTAEQAVAHVRSLFVPVFRGSNGVYYER